LKTWGTKAQRSKESVSADAKLGRKLAENVRVARRVKKDLFICKIYGKHSPKSSKAFLTDDTIALD
jgi:hypothetical protein